MTPSTRIRRPVGGEITPRKRVVGSNSAAQRSRPKPKPFAQYAPSHNVTWVSQPAHVQKRPSTPQAAQARPKQPAATVPTPQKAPAQAHEETRAQPSPQRKHKLWQSLQIPLIILGGLALGILAQSAIVGQTLIIVYGVIAYLRRIESRVTFTLAILTIVTTILLIVTQNNSQLSQAFAGYTFLFLLIGIICAFRESHEEGKLLSKKRGIFRLRQAKSTRP